MLSGVETSHYEHCKPCHVEHCSPPTNGGGKRGCEAESKHPTTGTAHTVRSFDYALRASLRMTGQKKGKNIPLREQPAGHVHLVKSLDCARDDRDARHDRKERIKR